MPELRKNDSPDSPETPAEPPSFSMQAERLLRNADRLLKESPDRSSQGLAMAHVEQAKVRALLQLAEAIRENRKA
jgi:hypothetical protein